jgi:hypothetical protein
VGEAIAWATVGVFSTAGFREGLSGVTEGVFDGTVENCDGVFVAVGVCVSVKVCVGVAVAVCVGVNVGMAA